MPRSRSRRDGDAFDDALERELLREVDDSKERDLVRRADQVRARATDVQLAAIDDPAKRKAARCSRRAGKTTTVVLYAGDFFPRQPEKVGWYIAPTLKQARRLMWSPMRKLSRELGLGLQFHKTDATITWPNDAALWLAGADDQDSLNAMLGFAPSIIFVDEVAAFDANQLEYLIEEVLEPSLMDEDGTMVLLSTPGQILAGRYYEITGPHGTQITRFADGVARAVSKPYRERRQPAWKGVTTEWSLHTWGLKDNTARPDLWKKALAKKKLKGWSDDNPIWRRQYLGEWTEADPHLRTFVYDEGRDSWSPPLNEHGFASLDGVVQGPKGPVRLGEHEWRFLIGMDQGSSDPFAIQVAAWSYTSPLLLHCYEWETKRITVPELALQLELVAAQCGGWNKIDEVVSDHGQLGDVILDTLREQYGIVVEKADKKNKLDHQELTNGELKDGRAKILKRSRLAGEMAVLQNDPKRPGKTIGGTNNNTDAYTYLAHRAREKNTRQRAIVTPAEQRESERRAEVEAFLAKRRKKSETETPQLETHWETTTWHD